MSQKDTKQHNETEQSRTKRFLFSEFRVWHLLQQESIKLKKDDLNGQAGISRLFQQ